MTLLSTNTPDQELTGTYLNWFWAALVIILVVVGLIWLGWRNRKRRQAHLPAPRHIPEEILGDEPSAAGEGMVIGTVRAEDYLDRVAAHSLGIRTDGRIEVHESGVAVFRAGAPNYLIPREALRHRRTDRGIVGKFVERDGALIIGWRLGDQNVETAFRARHAAAHQQLLEELGRLTSHGESDQESAI